MTSVKEMDVDVSAILAPGKFFYHKLGLWFETYSNVGRRKRALRFLTTLNISLFIAMSITNILDMREKALAESALEVIFLVRQISVLQKIFVFRSRVSEISELFSNAFEKICVPDLVNDVFEKYRNNCKLKPTLIIIFSVMTYFNGLFWLISIVALVHFGESELSASSLIAGGTAVPMWLPFDINKYPLVQKILLAYQIIGLIPIMVIFMGFFAFYSGALKLAHEMYTHLNDVLILLQKPINQDPPFDYELYIRQNKEVKDILKYTVQHHIRSLNYIAELNKIFSTVMLLEIWGILGIQCLLAFQFASIDGLPLHRQLALVQNVTVTTMQLVVICYLSTQVTALAKKVSSTTFGTAWWSWDSSNQLSMKIINIRSSEPVELKGGHVYSLTLTTVAAITEISFTYFMFLYQLNQQKET